MINRTNTRRIAIALALGGALLVGYPAVSGGLLWDVGAACGYVCLILFVCLYIFPVRGDGLPHVRLLGLSQHKFIGWSLLIAASAHVAAVLLAQPLSSRYLLPSAPVFMWCGFVALLFIAASVITGLSARSQMRRSLATAETGGVGSQAGAVHSRATLHVVLAAVLMLTACAHVVGSAQLLSGAVKTVIVLLLLSLPLGWYALRPRGMRQHAAAGAAQSMASPARVAARRASHLAAVGLIALLPATTAKQFLLEPVTKPAVIALNFPHELHTSVSCVTCHHNYVDHTGTTACIECHRSSRTDLGRSSEQTFHTFCRDCHTQLALDRHEHGPTRSCAACHQGIRSNNL